MYIDNFLKELSVLNQFFWPKSIINLLVLSKEYFSSVAEIFLLDSSVITLMTLWPDRARCCGVREGGWGIVYQNTLRWMYTQKVYRDAPDES